MRPRAASRVQIVPTPGHQWPLYIYRGEAYTKTEWERRERLRAKERARKARIERRQPHLCEAPCPVMTPRPLCYFHARGAA